jgi:hypothetical protein
MQWLCPLLISLLYIYAQVQGDEQFIGQEEEGEAKGIHGLRNVIRGDRYAGYHSDSSVRLLTNFLLYNIKNF